MEATLLFVQTLVKLAANFHHIKNSREDQNSVMGSLKSKHGLSNDIQNKG